MYFYLIKSTSQPVTSCLMNTKFPFNCHPPQLKPRSEVLKDPLWCAFSLVIMIANFRRIAVLISLLVPLAGHWVTRWTNDSLPPCLFNNLNLISNYVPVSVWSHIDEWDGKRSRSWIVWNLYLVINIDTSGMMNSVKCRKKWLLPPPVWNKSKFKLVIQSNRKRTQKEGKKNQLKITPSFDKHKPIEALNLGAVECTLWEDNYLHLGLIFLVFISTMIVCAQIFITPLLSFPVSLQWLCS